MTHLWQRVRRATPREVVDRGLDAARTVVEAFRTAAGPPAWHSHRLRLSTRLPALVQAREALHRRDLAAAESALRSHYAARPARFAIDPQRRRDLVSAVVARFPGAAVDAARRADPLLDGRYDLLGYRGLAFHHGTEAIDWHFDPVHGRQSPRTFWARVPYLDPATGDHKIIWELNRHQHWLALGRAAWLTGERRYVAAGLSELESWLRANPPLVGINWSSMLELAFRSISWIWALHLFLPFDVDPRDTWLLNLLTGLDRQLDHVCQHLSTYFSPNTHLLGEGLALYVAGRVLPELASAPRWEACGRAILLREAHRQVHPDGGHAELSPHYHRYALDFYLLALATARRTGDRAATPFAEVTSRLSTFCRTLADDNGRLPTIGDDDGGLLFPMCGRTPADARDSLALAAALLDRPELAIGDPPEETFWMLGSEPAVSATPDAAHTPPSRLFADTGYAVLRGGTGHAVVDVGRHGFLNGGHAHADALSIVLSIDACPLLIDPGTATYTMDREIRDRFRSTAMHNTGIVNGRPQSEPAGPFHWQSRADARPLVWRTAAAGAGIDLIEGEHDGYLPLLHRRCVLRIADGPWVIVDHLLGSGVHRIDLFWHLDPAWVRDAVTGQYTHASGPHAALRSTAPITEVFHGDATGLGWCAPVYGRMVPATTVRTTAAGAAPLSAVTAIAGSRSPVELSVAHAPTTVDRPDHWHRTAAVVTVDGTSWLIVVATPPACAGDDAGMDARPLPRRDAAGGQPPPIERAACRAVSRDGVLVTDARVVVLSLSPTDEPLALALVGATGATWSGGAAFAVPPAAAPRDLYVDTAGLRALRESGGGAERPA